MVFISYQWDIQDKVLKLKKKLEAKKITCWMDTGKMMGGDDLKAEIDKGIRGCKVSAGTCRHDRVQEIYRNVVDFSD
jgi:hypothetical protein